MNPDTFSILVAALALLSILSIAVVPKLVTRREYRLRACQEIEQLIAQVKTETDALKATLPAKPAEEKTLAEEFPQFMTTPATPFLRLIENTIVTHPEFGQGYIVAVTRYSVTVKWDAMPKEVLYTDPTIALRILPAQIKL